MSFSHWQRIKNYLIELSLTSAGAPADSRVWELRLEGETLQLRLYDDKHATYEEIVIERQGTKYVSVKVHDVEFGRIDNSTLR